MQQFFDDIQAGSGRKTLYMTHTRLCFAVIKMLEGSPHATRIEGLRKRMNESLAFVQSNGVCCFLETMRGGKTGVRCVGGFRAHQEINDLRRELKTLQGLREAEKASYATRISAMEEQQADTCAAMGEAKEDSLRAEAESLDVCNALRADGDFLRRELNASMQQILDTEAELEGALDGLANTDAALQSTRKALEQKEAALQSAVLDVREEVYGAQKELEDTEAALQKARAEAAALRGLCQGTAAGIKRALEELEVALQSAFVDVRDEVCGVQAELRGVQQALQKATAAAAVAGQGPCCGDQLDDARIEVEETREELKVKDAEIEALRAELATVKTQHTAMGRDLTAMTRALQSRTRALGEREIEAAALRELCQGTAAGMKRALDELSEGAAAGKRARQE